MAEPENQMLSGHLVIRVMFKVGANVSAGLSLVFETAFAKTTLIIFSKNNNGQTPQNWPSVIGSRHLNGVKVSSCGFSTAQREKWTQGDTTVGTTAMATTDGPHKSHTHTRRRS
ncbi:hypothetical protein JOB18_036814 [Solea senegalensis]|uniref:Uncharacterized protein n=1 Tax=Solea senegalensis TaxID=28829 RepID=A0AAV6R6G9_SOLSE|nr:hypothetical protein JOB18_036814 [Solea senegalensis]